MSSNELFDKVLEHLLALKPEFQIPLLQSEMLMECCEKAVATSYDGDQQIEVLILSSLQAFEVCQSLIKAMVEGLVPDQADSITLNYRGHKFVLDGSSV
ncbi:hypothetical protein [Dyadobacter sp. LHD-138]|uniref:hypothetical protein n=1 Tax=Dyadobacter sp. LHD-138 TaxID=3071413 RepID=UPI0027E0C445|nr:hypothetical protein [Dyadobacter sp. LHD-138]MDQ6482575.1 hypothetical protein [Dyadobacter sp. LHD-138]